MNIVFSRCRLSILLLAFFIPACAMLPPPQWDVETYPYSCSGLLTMPFEPVCLIRVGEGFEYSGEFTACKQSVENYIDALYRHYDCVMNDLRERYNLFLDQSKKTLSCFEEKLPDKYNPKLIIDCPLSHPVNIRIDRHYLFPIYHDAPYCITNKSFFPVDKSWSLERCTNEVSEYLEDTKRKIKDISFDLRLEIDWAADTAVRKFNCYAKREQFCF